MGERADFVIIFASSDLARFWDLAHRCSSAGLLGDFLLVDENRHAEVHIGRKTSKLSDHLAFLATRPGGTEAVTVVALACGKVEDSTREQRNSIVRDLRVRCREMKIGFREGTISVPIDSRELSPSFIEEDWAFNLVAVPEDWTGEQGQIGLPITESSAEDIAFNLVMSATGLWAWNDGAPLYRGLLLEHLSTPPIRLVRGSTRIVPLGDVANSIALAAMDPSNNWPPPPECEKHPNNAEFVKRTVEALANVPEIGMRFLEPSHVEQESRQRVGILDAIVIYFSALVANLIGIPKRAWQQAKERAIRRVEDYVQDRTFQNESKLVIRYGGRLREEDFAGSAIERIRAIESDSGVDVPAVIPNSQGWRILVRAVLGAVDGEPPGDEVGYKAPVFRGKPAVASSREVIAPNPALPQAGDLEAPLTVKGKLTNFRIRAFDSIHYRELSNDLAKRTESPQQSSPAEAVEAASEPNPPYGTTYWGVENEVELDPSETVNALRLIAEWVAHRQETLLWGISKFVDTQIAEVTTRLESSMQKVAAIPQRITQAEVKQRKAAKRGKWLARLMVLLLIFAVVFPFLPFVASAGLLAGGALAIALFFLPYLALLGVIAAWIGTAKTQVREQFRMENDLIKEYEAASIEREHYWREMHRLEYFHIQYLDWAEILADVVWRPFGAVDSQDRGALTVPDVRSVSFQFARPEFDDLRVKREQIAMRELVAGRGWLNNVFLSLKREFEEEYSQLVRDDNPTARQPEMDTSLEDEGYQVKDFTIYRPRGHFLKMVREGQLSLRIASAKADQLRAAVSGSDFSRLIKHVNAHAFVDVNGSEISRDNEHFLLSILDLEHVPKFERFVLRTGEKNDLSVGAVYWSSVGVETSADSLINPIAEEMPHRQETSAQFLASTRLEISQARFDTAELRFLEQSNEIPIISRTKKLKDESEPPLEPPID